MECVFACQTLAYFDESDSLFLFVKQYLLALRASFLPRAQRGAALLRTFYNHCFLFLQTLPQSQRWRSCSVHRFLHLVARWVKSFVFSLFSWEKESRVFPRIIVNKVR